MGAGISKTVNSFESEIDQIKAKVIDYLGIFYSNGDFHLKNSKKSLVY